MQLVACVRGAGFVANELVHVLGAFCAVADTPADVTDANAGPTLPNPVVIPEFAHHVFNLVARVPSCMNRLAAG